MTPKNCWNRYKTLVRVTMEKLLALLTLTEGDVSTSSYVPDGPSIVKSSMLAMQRFELVPRPVML